jgi:hypothetical protein
MHPSPPSEVYKFATLLNAPVPRGTDARGTDTHGPV